MDELAVSDLVPRNVLYGSELIRDKFSQVDERFPSLDEVDLDANEEFQTEDDT